MKIALTQLIIELSRQVRDGEDVANEDAKRLFDWLDRNGGQTWLTYRNKSLKDRHAAPL